VLPSFPLAIGRFTPSTGLPVTALRSIWKPGSTSAQMAPGDTTVGRTPCMTGQKGTLYRSLCFQCRISNLPSFIGSFATPTIITRGGQEAAKDSSCFSQSRCATLTYEPPITARFLESTSLGWRHLLRSLKAPVSTRPQLGSPP
jgi:hypothetical protein